MAQKMDCGAGLLGFQVRFPLLPHPISPADSSPWAPLASQTPGSDLPSSCLDSVVFQIPRVYGGEGLPFPAISPCSEKEETLLVVRAICPENAGWIRNHFSPHSPEDCRAVGRSLPQPPASTLPLSCIPHSPLPATPPYSPQLLAGAPSHRPDPALLPRTALL